VISNGLLHCLQTPWRPREPWPQEAAEAHYLIGMCHMELKNYLEALSGFTEAIKLDANYAEVIFCPIVLQTS